MGFSRPAIICALIIVILLKSSAIAQERLLPVNLPIGFTSQGSSSNPLERPFLETLIKLTSNGESDYESIKNIVTEQDWEKEHKQGLSTVEILVHSGFEYEVYESVALDGYVTQLVRMVNPLVERRHLRRVPVVFYTGQGVSPAAFLATSSKSHRQPLEWFPGQDSDDNLFTNINSIKNLGEANRSLAVMLSNHGFDVWLVPTRGVDAQNRVRRTTLADQENSARGASSPTAAIGVNKAEYLSLELAAKLQVAQKDAENLVALPDAPDLIGKLRQFSKKMSAKNYWSFCSDEIIEYEIESQLDKVRSESQAEKLSVVSYSNGGFLLFGFLAKNPAYAENRLDAVINLAPAVFVNKLNLVLAFAGLASNLQLPFWPFPQDKMDELARHGVMNLCKSKPLRYSVCKALINKLYGDSDLFRTQIDLAIFDYIGRPGSANGFLQMLQVAKDGKFHRYDHGILGNLIFYGRGSPDTYDLKEVIHKKLYVFSGLKDAIVDQSSLTYLMGSIGVKPESWVQIPNYNHLDLLVARDNARTVNLPVLKILIDRDLEVNYYDNRQDSRRKVSTSGSKLDDTEVETETKATIADTETIGGEVKTESKSSESEANDKGISISGVSIEGFGVKQETDGVAVEAAKQDNEGLHVDAEEEQRAEVGREGSKHEEERQEGGTNYDGHDDKHEQEESREEESRREEEPARQETLQFGGVQHHTSTEISDRSVSHEITNKTSDEHHLDLATGRLAGHFSLATNKVKKIDTQFEQRSTKTTDSDTNSEPKVDETRSQPVVFTQVSHPSVEEQSKDGAGVSPGAQSSFATTSLIGERAITATTSAGEESKASLANLLHSKILTTIPDSVKSNSERLDSTSSPLRASS